jgi:hypothetical protein
MGRVQPFPRPNSPTALQRGKLYRDAHPPEVQIGLLDPKDVQVAEAERRSSCESTLPSNALMEA